MRLLFSVLAISLAFACTPDVKDAVVVGKDHEPSGYYMTMIPVLAGKATIMVPMTMFDDEDFILIVESKIDGEVRRQKWYAASREQWDKINIGDHVSRLDGSILTEDEHTRVDE